MRLIDRTSIVFYSSADICLVALLILRLISDPNSYTELPGEIYIRKEKKNTNLLVFKGLLKIPCFVFSQLSSEKWLMVHVDYLMIATILERCDLWHHVI